MKLQTRWAIEIAIILIPIIVLIGVGLYWLWLTHYFWLWFAGTSLVAAVIWIWHLRLSRQEKPVTESIQINAAEESQAGSDAVWQKIEAISLRKVQQATELGDIQFYLDTFVEVVQTVAEHFHPGQKQALLEVRIPYLLAIVEMVSKDLRVGFADHVPASHILTLNDLVKGRRLANQGIELYRWLRLAFTRFSPTGIFAEKVKNAAAKEVYAETLDDIKRSLIDQFVKKVGYYAIELYSENLALNDEQLAACIDRKTQSDMVNIREREDRLFAEPLTIVVMGQTNAGKSSLINALFGKLKAETDAIPSTKEVIPYWLERPGLDGALILDCEGYGQQQNGEFIAKGMEMAKRSDMILLVISMVNAARDLDRLMLREIENMFLANHRSKMPPLIVVLTHIDQLRPTREWQPPYNIATPDSTKASSIRQAIDYVSEDLQVPTDQVAVVCLAPGREYNVEEGLIPTILQQFDQAQGIRYTRCLKNYQKQDYWRRLWIQSKNAGQFIAKKSFKLFEKKIH